MTGIGMKAKISKEPRIFDVIHGKKIKKIKDYGKILLGKDELVTINLGENCDVDIVATEWGCYPMPSIGHRLLAQGLRCAFVENKEKKRYLLLVKHDKQNIFRKYINDGEYRLIFWLDEASFASL